MWKSFCLYPIKLVKGIFFPHPLYPMAPLRRWTTHSPCLDLLCLYYGIVCYYLFLWLCSDGGNLLTGMTRFVSITGFDQDPMTPLYQRKLTRRVIIYSLCLYYGNWVLTSTNPMTLLNQRKTYSPCLDSFCLYYGIKQISVNFHYLSVYHFKLDLEGRKDEVEEERKLISTWKVSGWRRDLNPGPTASAMNSNQIASI